MRKAILCAVAAMAMSGSVSLGQSGLQGAAPLTVIRAGTLIDGVSETPRKNQLIFVRGERIEKVADASAAIPSGARVFDHAVNQRSRANHCQWRSALPPTLPERNTSAHRHRSNRAQNCFPHLSPPQQPGKLAPLPRPFARTSLRFDDGSVQSLHSASPILRA